LSTAETQASFHALARTHFKGPSTSAWQCFDVAGRQPPKAPAQAQTFLVLAKSGAQDKKVIPLRPSRLESFHLSPSGKYLAFTEALTTKDYRSERHLWVKNLQSGEDKELFAVPPPNPPASPQPNETVVVLGWIENDRILSDHSCRKE